MNKKKKKKLRKEMRNEKWEMRNEDRVIDKEKKFFLEPSN